MSGSSIIDVTADPEQVTLRGDAPSDASAPISHVAFVGWLLGGVLMAMLAIGAFNWVIDPTGVTGRATRWRIADNAEVRSEKLDLYEAMVHGDAPPEIVLLGSSRVMKFDPRDVERLTGRPAFNASVSGGVPRDAWLFTRLIAEQQPGKGAFPHLVWGLDVDAFRDKQLRDGLATDPRMTRFIPRRERIATAVAGAGTLTELQTLKASVRSIRSGGAPKRRGPASARRFSAQGFQEWSLPFPRTQSALERSVRTQIAQYAGFIFERDAYDGITQQPLDDFVDVIRIANDNGDTPTIFLTPYHPLGEQLLAQHEIAAREREVRSKLRELQRDGDVRFEVVDLTSLASFDGDPRQFYDGVHMTPRNTRRALAVLQEQGVLAPPEQAR